MVDADEVPYVDISERLVTAVHRFLLDGGTLHCINNAIEVAVERMAGFDSHARVRSSDKKPIPQSSHCRNWETFMGGHGEWLPCPVERLKMMYQPGWIRAAEPGCGPTRGDSGEQVPLGTFCDEMRRFIDDTVDV